MRDDDERNARLAPPGDPEFATFDASFMEARNVPAGQIAIMHEGHLRYTRGYGLADPEDQTPTNASSTFRTASISKLMTYAVLSLLAEEGRIAWDQFVFCRPGANCVLPIQPHPDHSVVARRICDVALQHLVDDTGGRGRPYHPMLFAPAKVFADSPLADTITVAQQLGVPSPPVPWQMAQWLMGQPMSCDPGSNDEYCNACYLRAGLEAEAATGATIEDLYNAYLWQPLDLAGEQYVGRSDPEFRGTNEARFPGEPFYDVEDCTITNVFNPSEKVCWPDGGRSMQAAAVGGVAATAAGVTAVDEAYTDQARYYDETVGIRRSGHSGGLPQTATFT